MTDAPRVIAEIRDWDQLIDAFRTRVSELDTTNETIDYVAGLPLRYTQKVLSRVKTIGSISLGPYCGTLGVKLLLVDDPATFAQIAHRLTKRRTKRNNASGRMLARKKRKRSAFRGCSEWGRHMACRQYLLMSPAQRRARARKAARARWRRYSSAAAPSAGAGPATRSP